VHQGTVGDAHAVRRDRLVAAVRRAPWAVALTTLVVSVGTIVIGNGAATAEIPPPSKRVYMITDSVGLGAENAMAAAFGAGWQFTLDGDPGEFTETLASKYVRPRITQTPTAFGDYAIVAAGYNYPYWDPGRFDRSVDEMVATLLDAGVKHVLWVTLREVKQQFVSPGAWRQIQPYYWYFPTVNDRLEMALSRHPQLSLIDWAAVADQPGLTYDAIHLNIPGAALYSAIARQAVIDATTAAPGGSVTRIAIPNATGVEAVALNLTTTAPRALGFLTAYDCDGEQPTVSNHNYTRALIAAHAAVVPVSASGEVCIFDNVSTNLVVDITGRFSAAVGIGDTKSTRLVDTRDRGTKQPALTPLVVSVGTPPGAPVVLNVTAVDADAPGWVRAAPCDSTNTTSTVNFDDAAPVPNVAVVVPSADGTICVTSSVATHLIVDRLLQFAAGGGIDVVTPQRVLDTRDGSGAGMVAGDVVRLDADTLGVTAGTTGVLLNLTVTDASAPGFLTAYPCADGLPTTSNLNYVAGEVVANFAVVQPDASGDVCVYALTATHLVVDLMGTASAGFTGGAPQRLLDTRQSNLPPNWP
jgi:hypothetical protein